LQKKKKKKEKLQRSLGGIAEMKKITSNDIYH